MSVSVDTLRLDFYMALCRGNYHELNAVTAKRHLGPEQLSVVPALQSHCWKPGQ